MADTRKSEQLGHEFVQTGCVFPEVNQAGMELGGLRRQPHDLCCRMALIESKGT